MRRDRFGMAVLCAVVLSASVGAARAEELWSVPKGTIGIAFDQAVLQRFGLNAPALGTSSASDGIPARLEFATDKENDLSFVVGEDGIKKLNLDRIGLADGLQLVGPAGTVIVLDLLVAEKHGPIEFAATTPTDPVGSKLTLDMYGVRASFNPSIRMFSMPIETLRISRDLAAALGNIDLANVPIGWAVVRGMAQWESGDRPVSARIEKSPEEIGSTANAPVGPDVTFCELYGLQQQGRLGSVIGCALATTSWNIGNEDAIWFELPDERHPFIAMNLYRLKGDRFEQIGQSWVKHAFFALSDTQCGGNCTYEPGHGVGDWLGQNCTDTYSAGLNGAQGNMGPRHEINPWNGAYEYTGSHMQGGGGGHNAISHRLQVHDNDLHGPLNPGATYYAEGYYVIGWNDDVFHMNNASWKPVTPSGSPNNPWSFTMSSASVDPTIGFAIDAWPGARKTVLSEQIPVVERTTIDGRCVLGAKATDNGNGTWHYEYALLNVDMNRKAKSFRVPIRPGTAITNVDFHAVLSHDEPYSNTPWTPTVGPDSIMWETTDNPLRWGTVYNFRFDAEAIPVDTTITLGLYEPGTITEVTGITTGPAFFDPNCPIPTEAAVASGAPLNRYLAIEPGNAGEQTAIRVRLASLLQTNGVEGEFRWVGPASSYPDPQGPGPSFMAGPLQCTPHFADWGAMGTVYVHGAEIMPFSSYDVQLLHEDCASGMNDPAVYSPAISVPTAVWGDVVAPHGTLANPNSQPNFLDISSLVAKFQKLAGSVEKPRGQLQPNAVDPSNNVDFADISVDVDAFRGEDYPFSGPVACP